jgi:hypothetical protein
VCVCACVCVCERERERERERPFVCGGTEAAGEELVEDEVLPQQPERLQHLRSNQIVVKRESGQMGKWSNSGAAVKRRKTGQMEVQPQRRQ